MDVPENPAAVKTTAAARRAFWGLGVREIGLGAVGVGLVMGAAVLLNRHSAATGPAAQALAQDLVVRRQAAESYSAQWAVLQKQAVLARAAADAERAEPERTWARERARRFEALLAMVRRDRVGQSFGATAAEITALINRRELATARQRLAALPVVRFPAPPEFERLKRDVYEAPLAAFSRQNPDFYRAFRRYEPEASRRDESALRAEIAAAGEAVTPQTMAKVDLLAAVAAVDDPLVARWSERASALQYFEAPGPETLARWESAQRALRAGDWPSAVAQMQAISKSTVRTRQPFRAALGRALLKTRPDQPDDAYGFLAEAAAGGDKQARAWVAHEDLRNCRYAQARHWLEARLADGERDAVPELIAAYEHSPDAPGTAAAVQRITERPDAPPEAWLLLGRLYERGDPADSAKAYECYGRAAAKKSGKAEVQVARCALRAIGTLASPDLARDAACRGFALGEREAAAAILLPLLRDNPDRTTAAVEELFERESVAAGGGYTQSAIVDGPGVTELKMTLARRLDRAGNLSAAARLYGGLHDPASVNRHAELTTGHACETCGGAGKVLLPAPCPTCGGKGNQICSYCGGTGFIYAPATPPCGTCGGTGTAVEDRKIVACGACGGTGKGKGSVVKQDCPHCDHGHVRCSECTGGFIKVARECPACHGRGTWSLAERGR